MRPTLPDGRTVLIADDDPDVRHVLRLLFEIEGYSVVGEAANGLETIALAERLKPDFVILDEVMPLMTGTAAATTLRAVSPTTRIVAFSGVLESKPTWADAYLNKERIGDISPLLATLVASA